MGAPNFASTNLSRYYVFPGDYDWWDGDAVADLQWAIKQAAEKLKEKYYTWYCEDDRYGHSLSYPRRQVGSLECTVYYDKDEELNFTVGLTVYLVYGYYQGGNADVEEYYEYCDGKESADYFGLDDILEIAEWAGVELSEDEAAELSRQIDQMTGDLWDVLEAEIEKVTTPMVRVAVFSNGEAIYELAD